MRQRFAWPCLVRLIHPFMATGFMITVGCGGSRIDSSGQYETQDSMITGPGHRDECNTTRECRHHYGDSATDCYNSRSNQSVCLCGRDPCTAATQDECDTTAQCQTIYPNADDCFDSRSNASVCYCAGRPCSDQGSDNDPPADECDTTAQCQRIYPNADDCFDSRSNASVCYCAGRPCNEDAPPHPPPGSDDPTCSDGVRNQGESGVDCGGPCPPCDDQATWRWAHSGDGNQHDPDDWHASAMALALMHHAGLKQRLVHFNWNNHLGDNSSSMERTHTRHVETARDIFGYGDSFDDVFWNCQDNIEDAVNHLARVINESSATNRLILTCAGPMEVCWRGIDAADDSKERFVTVISHSHWNDNHRDTSQMNHQWGDIQRFDVQAHHINDQNPPAFNSDCSAWSWLKDLSGYGDTFYDLICDDRKAGDASDAGMVYYTIRQNGTFSGTSGQSSPSMSEVRAFFMNSPPPDPPDNPPDPPPNNDDPFTEVNGTISFEMEALDPRGAWSLQSSIPGYSGTGYFYWTGKDSFKNPPQDSVLTVTLRVQNAGRYRMTIRSRRNRSGVCAGAANDQCNDIFTKVNGDSWCKTLLKAQWDEWITSTRLECTHGEFTAPIYDFRAGDNTLRITGRSRGIHLDNIRFVRQ